MSLFVRLVRIALTDGRTSNEFEELFANCADELMDVLDVYLCSLLQVQSELTSCFLSMSFSLLQWHITLYVISEMWNVNVVICISQTFLCS